MVINSVKQVKKIISQHFTDFNIEEIKYLGEGANNCIYEINNKYIFRFPKHQKAEKDCQKEIYVIKDLQNSINRLENPVKLLIPNIVFIGNNKSLQLNFLLENLLGKYKEKIQLKFHQYYNHINLDNLKIYFNCYNKIFLGYEKIEGQQLEWEIFENFDLEQKKFFAQLLSTFLLLMHNLKCEQLEKYNFDQKNFDRNYYLFIYEHLSQYILPNVSKFECNILSDLFNAFINEPLYYQYKPCLIHGDIHSENIIFNQLHNSIGIIDFGEVCLGDPGYDFFIIYYNYGKLFLEEVCNYYGTPLNHYLLAKIQLLYIGWAIEDIKLAKKTNNKYFYEKGWKMIKETLLEL